MSDECKPGDWHKLAEAIAEKNDWRAEALNARERIANLTRELDRCRKVVEAAKAVCDVFADGEELLPPLYELSSKVDEYEKGGG